MNINQANILITGAAGGIGSATARRLAAAGASVLLTDLRRDSLEPLRAELDAAGNAVLAVPADVCQAQDRERLAQAAAESGVNVLINIAGINPFGLFRDQSDGEIERALAINTLAPMLLCRALLPVLTSSDEAHIVNVGSVFGSLGYPGFAVYSASKFAIRGFTEAMRRELASSSVRLHYVSPRATRTALSTDRISAMNAELKVATDEPDTVALAIEKTLRRSRRECYLGRPERFFALINAVLPGLVDRMLHRQLPIVERYAARGQAKPARPERESVQMKLVGVKR